MSRAQPSVLVVDDDPSSIRLLADTLEADGYRTLVARTAEDALDIARRRLPRVIVMDVMLPGIDGITACRELRADERIADIPVLLMTGLTDVEHKLAGFRAGAVDYLVKPLHAEEVKARLAAHLALAEHRRGLTRANQELERRVQERTAELEDALHQLEQLSRSLEAENERMRQRLGIDGPGTDAIVGDSPAIRHALSLLQSVAPTEAAVLLTGETGTGKELFAHALHMLSPRSAGPFVVVNCGAVPESLIESELFGHERGAFTGAAQARAGKFERAHGGTLFLDEVGELKSEHQSRLLRVLQDGRFERVGGSRVHRADVRIVAATNRDLEREVDEGRFRSDLYYRLAVFPIRLPPLRERMEDLPTLAAHLLPRICARHGINVPEITDAALLRLAQHTWPGNVRELRHVLERAAITSQGELNLGSWSVRTPAAATGPERTLEEVERAHMTEVLLAAGWQVSGPGGAAERLGLNPSTLRSRMRKLGIRRPEPRS